MYFIDPSVLIPLVGSLPRNAVILISKLKLTDSALWIFACFMRNFAAASLDRLEILRNLRLRRTGASASFFALSPPRRPRRPWDARAQSAGSLLKLALSCKREVESAALNTFVPTQIWSRTSAEVFKRSKSLLLFFFSPPGRVWGTIKRSKSFVSDVSIISSKRL